MDFLLPLAPALGGVGSAFFFFSAFALGFGDAPLGFSALGFSATGTGAGDLAGVVLA